MIICDHEGFVYIDGKAKQNEMKLEHTILRTHPSIMGDESGVSRSIRLVKEGRVAGLERLKKRLLQRAIGDQQNENELPG